MAKALFRPSEVALVNGKVFLDAPFPDAKVEEIEEIPSLEDAEVYSGPTADDLRREAEAFKAHWAEEKESMISGARAEAAVLVTDARKTAEEETEKARAALEAEREAAKQKAEALLAEAAERVKKIEAESAVFVEEAKQKGMNEGSEQGRKAGYEQGMEEVRRLAARTQLVLERIQDRRAEILADAEQQIVELVLLISRKVVKSITETQRAVVVENIKEALHKVKSKGTVIVKVNMNDLEISTAHREEFNALLEGSGSIQIHEDSSIDAGGCVVETDFGQIDARIASQLAELESKILALSPVKS